MTQHTGTPEASIRAVRSRSSSTVICAEIDPLRSEGELLAEKLEQAGVEVRHKTFHGSTHEFFGMAAVVPQAKTAQADAVAALKTAFEKSTARGGSGGPTTKQARTGAS